MSKTSSTRLYTSASFSRHDTGRLEGQLLRSCLVRMRRFGATARLALALCGCTLTQGFLMPMGGSGAAVRHGLARSGQFQLFSAVQEPPTTAKFPPPDTDVSLEGLEDINDYFEPEPVDPTPEQLAAMTKELASTKVKDGRTVEQWLKQDDPCFKDGSRVAAWVKEAERLRVLPFIERAEQLKSLSFEELNAFRFRSSEWKEMLIQQGIVEPMQPAFPEDQGVTTLSEEEYKAKLQSAKEKFGGVVDEEIAMLDAVERMLEAGRFEGKALDNSVVVTLNGKMEPLSCTITEEAFARVDHKSLSQAIEAATELAFRQASDFFEEAMADEYINQAKTPTDVEGIAELLGRKVFDTVGDATHPQFS